MAELAIGVSTTATSVPQVEKMVQISEQLGRPIASGAEARQIYKIVEFYSSIDETLEKNGWLPNRKPGPGGLRALA